MLSTNKKEIFERIAEVQQEVLLGDVVKILRALNEDIDDIIEVISSSLCLHYNEAILRCNQRSFVKLLTTFYFYFKVNILLDQFSINGDTVMTLKSCLVSIEIAGSNTHTQFF